MGQSSSSLSPSPPWSKIHRRRSITLTSSSSSVRSETYSKEEADIEFSDANSSSVDYISEIPDDCLALVFQFVSSGDRKRCALVSRRWLLVEGQSRHRLALNAQSELVPFVPSIFSRFDSITKLSLRCDRKSVSIDDGGLDLISLRCRNLMRLKLRGCREVTDVGMKALGKNCKGLKKFSCGSCMFGDEGIKALLDHCSSLEELSVKRLRGINDDGAAEPIGPGAAAKSLKSVCLKELYNTQLFEPLITGAKNLRTLKLMRCFGDWDELLETVAVPGNRIFEVHLERIQVSDTGLSALSNCSKLEILHIIKTPDCTDAGVIAVSAHCKYLRKLHIDGWRTNKIGNEALIAIGKHSINLQELVLIGINPSSKSLETIGMNCQKLERLALCGSETIADGEISCIASKCVALKKLCIKGCPVSDEGIEAFAWGCPNLVKIKVKKCRNVKGNVGDWLRARRGSLVVNLDVCAVEAETENMNASISENIALDDMVEFPPLMRHVTVAQPEPLAINSSGRRSVFKTIFGLFGGKGLMGSAFRRWSKNGNRSSNGTS